MKPSILTVFLLCLTIAYSHAQLTVKDSEDNQLMTVDSDANVVIGTSGQVGSLINMGDATLWGKVGIGYDIHPRAQVIINALTSGEYLNEEYVHGLYLNTEPASAQFTTALPKHAIGSYNAVLAQDELAGTSLETLTGSRISYGSRTSGASGQIEKAYGLIISPYQQGSTTITDMYDFYISAESIQNNPPNKHYGLYVEHDADNYFAGALGLGMKADIPSKLYIHNDTGGVIEGREEVRGLSVRTYPNDFSTGMAKRVMGIWNNVLAASEADDVLDRLTGTHIQYGTHTGSSGSIDKAIGINIAPYQNGGANVTTMIDLCLTNDVIGHDPENPPDKHWGIRIEHPADNYFSGALGLGREPDSDQYKLDVAGVIRCDNVSTTSDARLKKNITPLYSALDKITQLNGVEYLWRAEEYPNHKFSEEKQVGLIAQEVEHIIPEVVDQDAEGYRSIEYDALTPYLIEAIKEQQEEIELLRQQVKALQEK